MTQLHRCGQCGKNKPVSEFFKVKWGNGIGRICRLCNRYQQREYYRKNQSRFKVENLPERKSCSHCKVDKPRECFSLNRSVNDGLSAVCRDCTAIQTAKNKGRFETSTVWEKTLWRLKLRPSDFARMLIRQSGRCGICSEELFKPVIDHCHATGKVRGLLCTRCNTQLHGVERPGFVEAALAYLAEHN